jgi:hypothetical protein
VLARWACDHQGDIAALVGRPVVSISWLAADILPVGRMVYGALQPWASLSRRWIVVSTAHRLAHCEVAGHLIEMMRSLDRPYGELAVDRVKGNFRWFEARDIEGSPDSLARYPIEEGVIRTHPGGLYRGALLPFLLPWRRRMAE